MGRREDGQVQFLYAFDLDKVVPPDHLVRQIDGVLDLSWVHKELAPYYCRRRCAHFGLTALIRFGDRQGRTVTRLERIRVLPCHLAGPTGGKESARLRASPCCAKTRAGSVGVSPLYGSLCTRLTSFCRPA